MDRLYAISQHVHTPYTDRMPALVLNSFVARLTKDIQDKKNREKADALRQQQSPKGRK